MLKRWSVNVITEISMTSLATMVVFANTLHPLFHHIEGGMVDSLLEHSNVLVATWLNNKFGE